MSQWAEVRHLHLVERVPKKEIARRLKLDVKTVRRAISRSTTPVRVSPPRPGTLDPWRERIRQWLREEPRLTANPVERLESLLDGIESAFRYFGGLVDRLVLDNTSLAVKDVLAGRDRVQTEAFEAFRGGYPFRAEFCAPAKGWEKGSVEGGVKYVRNLVFRPRLAVESWTALNAAIITELDADLPTRQLDDGRSVEEALAQERQHLRAMPVHLPATCRVVARVADKFGHVRVDLGLLKPRFSGRESTGLIDEVGAWSFCCVTTARALAVSLLLTELGLSSAIAVAFEKQDLGMVGQAVDQSDGARGVGEDGVPAFEG